MDHFPSSFFINLIAWNFLPSIATNICLGIYYRIMYAGNASSIPKKGCTKYRVHYARMYSAIIVAYFAYSVAQSLQEIPKSFYDVIGISRSKLETDLKPRFKQLVLTLHPDKVPDADPVKFQRVKQIYEVLSDRSWRAAYDLFGKKVIDTVSKTSAKSSVKGALSDYFQAFIYDYLAFYAGGIVFTLLLTMVNRDDSSFWRLVLLSFFAALELLIATRPLFFSEVPSDLNWLWSPILTPFINRPPHYWIAFARSFALFGSMALSQMISAFRSTQPAEKTLDLVRHIHQFTAPLEQLVDTRFKNDTASLRQSEEKRAEFKRKVSSLIEQAQ